MVDLPGRAMSYNVTVAGDRVAMSVTDAATGIGVRPNLSADEARSLADLLRMCAEAAAVGTPQPGETRTQVGILRAGDQLALTVQTGLFTFQLPLSVLEASVLVENLRAEFETVVRDELPD